MKIKPHCQFCNREASYCWDSTLSKKYYNKKLLEGSQWRHFFCSYGCFFKWIAENYYHQQLINLTVNEIDIYNMVNNKSHKTDERR